MDNKSIGKKIRQKRKECGHSTQEFAELCHMSEGYLNQVENGSKLPALPLLITICENLKTSPNYLFSFVEDIEMKEMIEKCYKLTPEQLKLVNYLMDYFILPENQTINEP